MILQSISVTVFCLQISYNKFIGKIICFLGPLTFGVYLIHEHPLVRANFIRNLFSQYSQNLAIKKVIYLVFKKSILIFLTCSLIDFIRKIIFDILRIKTLLIFIEKKIFNLFK